MGSYHEYNEKKAKYIVDAVTAAIEKDMAERDRPITKEELRFFADVLDDVTTRLEWEREYLEEYRKTREEN